MARAVPWYCTQAEELANHGKNALNAIGSYKIGGKSVSGHISSAGKAISSAGKKAYSAASSAAKSASKGASNAYKSAKSAFKKAWSSLGRRLTEAEQRETMSQFNGHELKTLESLKPRQLQELHRRLRKRGIKTWLQKHGAKNLKYATLCDWVPQKVGVKRGRSSPSNLFFNHSACHQRKDGSWSRAGWLLNNVYT